MKNIKLSDIKKFKKEYEQDLNNKLLEMAITNNGINEVALNTSIISENKMLFNIELPESTRTNQKDSGRCWCYAGLNFLKHNIAKNMNIPIKNLNLSANYLTFYDKLEKMNTILEKVITKKNMNIETIKKLKISEYDEGGYWEFFKELIKKYGIIPLEYMKENKVSSNSEIANKIIDAKIKRDIYTILEYKKNNSSIKELEKLTKKLMQENYEILSKIFTSPPLIINLEYIDKDKKLITLSLTPQEFYKKYCTINIDDYISISSVDMYNKEYYKKYINNSNENIFNLGKQEFINLPKNEFKSLIIKQLKKKEPVWFATEIEEMFNNDNSILDTRIYNYEKLFNFKQLTTREGLNLNYYTSCHAMCMVGVHIYKSKPLRWKVENSWGDSNNNGYLVMNDNYFDKFVMEAAINKNYLTKKQLKVLKSKPINLDLNDPI